MAIEQAALFSELGGLLQFSFASLLSKAGIHSWRDA
jgi:hypothetical protein